MGKRRGRNSNEWQIHLQDTSFWIPAEKEVFVHACTYVWGKQIQLSVKQHKIDAR